MTIANNNMFKEERTRDEFFFLLFLKFRGGLQTSQLPSYTTEMFNEMVSDSLFINVYQYF